MQDSLLLTKRSKFLMLSGTLEATQMFILWFLHPIIIWGIVLDAYVEVKVKFKLKWFQSTVGLFPVSFAP